MHRVWKHVACTLPAGSLTVTCGHRTFPTWRTFLLQNAFQMMKDGQLPRDIVKTSSKWYFQELPQIQWTSELHLLQCVSKELRKLMCWWTTLKTQRWTCVRCQGCDPTVWKVQMFINKRWQIMFLMHGSSAPASSTYQFYVLDCWCLLGKVHIVGCSFGFLALQSLDYFSMFGSPFRQIVFDMTPQHSCLWTKHSGWSFKAKQTVHFQAQARFGPNSIHQAFTCKFSRSLFVRLFVRQSIQQKTNPGDLQHFAFSQKSESSFLIKFSKKFSKL